MKVIQIGRKVIQNRRKVIQIKGKVIRPLRSMPLLLSTSTDDCVSRLILVYHIYSNPVTRVTGFPLCQLLLP
jgi:hypothetical protein